jgi:phospholipid/cholesterol/gamma-HCH transport system substrate-binding protein
MDRDANYVAVGAFVVLVLAMAVGFIVWYTESGDRRDYRRYEIYFVGSVSGLSEGGSVRYLGVSVGRVARIALDPRHAGRVQVLADIDDKTPIGPRTVASLGLLGVTGLLFIDLKPAAAGPVARLVPGMRYPVIPSEQSSFDVLVSSLPDMVAQASQVAARLNAALSDSNLKAISETLAHVEHASRDLPPTVHEARQLMAELDKAARQIDEAASAVRDVAAGAAPEVKTTMTRLRTVADNLATASERVDRFVAENQANVTRFTGEGLAEVTSLVQEARAAAQEFRALSRSLKDDPSRVLYQPPPQGVEIPR